MKKYPHNAIKDIRSIQARVIGCGLVALIGFLVVGSMLWWRLTHQNVTFIVPEYTLVETEPNDPVAQGTLELIKQTERWLAEHLSYENEELLTAYVTFHNRLAPICRAQGLAIEDLAAFPEDAPSYINDMEPVSAYLASRGWAACFAIPAAMARDDGLRYTAPIWIGEIHSARQGTTTTYDGQEIPYEERLLEKVTMVKTPGFRPTSNTRNGVVTHFLDEFFENARRTVTLCRAYHRTGQKPTEPLDRAKVEQWAEAVETLDARSKELAYGVVMSDLLNCSSTHEEQHVRDSALLQLVDTGQVETQGALLIQMLMETRGLVAAVAGSRSPVYALAHAEGWRDHDSPINRMAGELAVGSVMDELSHVVADEASRSMKAEEIYQQAGRQAQQKLDPYYVHFLAHARDPDILESLPDDFKSF